MLAAGMGAGVGAIFRAPLAGAVFAGEILYSDADLEADAIVPAATASIVAYSVFTQALPADIRYVPLFGSQLNHSMASPIELLPYAALAVVLTLAGMLYVKLFYGTHDLFNKMPIIPHLRPAIGAALAGLFAIGLWHLFNNDSRVLAVLGTGYGGLQTALTAAVDLGIPLLLTIALAKIITTSLTISSGGSGGVFGPSMVIGGCLGAATGLVFQSIWPAAGIQPEAFAVVGMAGLFAGVARAPISTIIMVRAMTGRLRSAGSHDARNNFDVCHLSAMEVVSKAGPDSDGFQGPSRRLHCRCSGRSACQRCLSARSENCPHPRRHDAG